MKHALLFFSILILTSCSVEKNKMLSVYEPMFDSYCAGKFEEVFHSLDRESKTMIRRIVNNESTDSLIQIATAYGIPNLAVVKHVYFPSDLTDPNRIYDFIPFFRIPRSFIYQCGGKV